MTSTTIKHTLNQLAQEHKCYMNQLLACDPSSSEISMSEFFELQEWGQEIEAIVIANGFTIEEVEAASDALS